MDKVLNAIMWMFLGGGIVISILYLWIWYCIKSLGGEHE